MTSQREWGVEGCSWILVLTGMIQNLLGTICKCRCNRKPPALITILINNRMKEMMEKHHRSVFGWGSGAGDAAMHLQANMCPFNRSFRK